MTGHFLGFSPESFLRRRRRVMEALTDGVLLLPAAHVHRRSGDTEYRYRPDSELFYLTGCVEPGVLAVLRGSAEEGFLLFVPNRNAETELWTGPMVGPQEAGEIYGVDAVYPLEDLEEHLPEILRSRRQIHFRLGVHPRVEGLVLEALRWARERGAKTGGGPRSVVDPGGLLDDLRLFKDSEEISRIRRAADLTVGGFRAAMGMTRPGQGEWEVEAVLESAFRRGGARGPGFPTIVGSGRNGCVLHYTENKDVLEGGQLVLLDGGAELDLYSGDVTRTFPAGGKFSHQQLEVYEVVRRAHAAAISKVHPGSTIGHVHEAALTELTHGLVELGLLEGDVDQLLAEKAYEAHFPHRTSHWLGLDLHDVGDYATKAGPRTLEPGMVLTVEPGLYFLPNLNSPAHPYTGIGVRIEDDLLVTDQGAENLTASLPVHPQDVEAIVGSAGAK